MEMGTLMVSNRLCSDQSLIIAQRFYRLPCKPYSKGFSPLYCWRRYTGNPEDAYRQGVQRRTQGQVIGLPISNRTYRQALHPIRGIFHAYRSLSGSGTLYTYIPSRTQTIGFNTFLFGRCSCFTDLQSFDFVSDRSQLQLLTV